MLGLILHGEEKGEKERLRKEKKNLFKITKRKISQVSIMYHVDIRMDLNFILKYRFL